MKLEKNNAMLRKKRNPMKMLKSAIRSALACMLGMLRSAYVVMMSPPRIFPVSSASKELQMKRKSVLRGFVSIISKSPFSRRMFEFHTMPKNVTKLVPLTRMRRPCKNRSW